ncbi:unnamed protein product [Ectocarpus sp. CCAP 1310/34]|nr:unnamed protein product [Ectocarpus sp. CCAP 1310/34]
MLSERASSVLAVCCISLALLAAAQDACTVGTVQDNCVSATSGDNIDEFFFCTDRYSWEWSQDAEQLPVQASDSLCLTLDSSVVDGLDQTELLVLGGCDAEFQEVAGDCSSLSSSTRTYDPFLVSEELKEERACPPRIVLPIDTCTYMVEK